MRTLYIPLLLLMGLVFNGASCQSTGYVVATTAQQFLAGFSLSVEGSEPGQPAIIKGFMRGSSMGAAIDAEVDIKLVYRAPTVVGGEPVIVWSRSIKRGTGQRAYKVVFSGEKGSEFVQILKVSWAEARTWPGFSDLAEPTDGGPESEPASQPIPINRRPPEP